MKKLPRTVVFIGTFAAVVIVCVLIQFLFTVTTIQVSGESIVGLHEFNGKPLFLIDTNKSVTNLLEKNPTIEQIDIEKMYPHTLVISVKKSVQVGILAVSKGYYIVSSTGKVMAKEREKTHKLPSITIGQKFPYESYRVGEIMKNPGIITSTFLLGKFADNSIPIDTVEIRGFDVVVCKGAGRTYIFSASKNEAEQFSDFLVVYKQFFVENRKYSSIDMRFEKPIVVFEK